MAKNKKKKSAWLVDSTFEARGGVPKMEYVCLFSKGFSSSVSAENVTHILRKVGVLPLGCKKFFTEGNLVCSFKITIRKCDFDACTKSEIWPSHVRVRMWEEKRRPTSDNGNNEKSVGSVSGEGRSISSVQRV